MDALHITAEPGLSLHSACLSIFIYIYTFAVLLLVCQIAICLTTAERTFEYMPQLDFQQKSRPRLQLKYWCSILDQSEYGFACVAIALF